MGKSQDQKNTALRVASIPTRIFNAVVESEQPATVAAPAELVG